MKSIVFLLIVLTVYGSSKAFPVVSFTEEEFKIGSFFSPDTSIATLTKLVEQSTVELNISTPYWNSWIGCDGNGGCEVVKLKYNETFSIFPAVLNAVHRGVKVRVLSNAPSDEVKDYLFDTFSYLSVAGAEVRLYKTTAHLHVKYISIEADNERRNVSLSSVNYSETSMMKNREAGVVVECVDDGCDNTIHNYLAEVYDYDWNLAEVYKPKQHYSTQEEEEIRDKTKLSVVIPPPEPFECGYRTHTATFSGHFSGKIYSSPYNSLNELISELKGVKKRLWISIYEISQVDICQLIHKIAQNTDIDIKVLVSGWLYGSSLIERSNQCYSYLYNNSVTVMKTRDHCYTFSHQKFWLMDDKIVSLSTGNFDNADYPSDPSEEHVFRDFTLVLDHLVADERGNSRMSYYEDVFSHDYDSGSKWTPKSPVGPPDG